MIQIDRKSGVTIREQIASQFRYLVARGQFAVGSTLPSTRGLARELDVSFHTVRKAYALLEREGLVRSISGRGFVVEPLASGTDSAKMEVGAEIVRAAMQELIGLGLSESDIDYIFDEQLATMSGEKTVLKLVVVGEYREQADECARLLAKFRFTNVLSATPATLDLHEDADFVIAPFRLTQLVRQTLHRVEVLGVDLSVNREALDIASRMMKHETLTLVARYPDAVAPLTRDLRAKTGFPGQLLAGSIDHGSQLVTQIVAQADAVLYTQAAGSRIRSHLRGRRSAMIRSQLSEATLESVQRTLPAGFPGSVLPHG